MAGSTRNAPQQAPVRASVMDRALRALALHRSTAIVGSRGSGRSRLLQGIAHRLAADGVAAVLFTADARNATAPATAAGSIPMTPLAREVGKLGLREIAHSQRLGAALVARSASLVVLVDEPGRLSDDDRSALPQLAASPHISLVTSWSPRDWSALLDTQLDASQRDLYTELIDAELITLPPLTPDEVARMLRSIETTHHADPLTVSTLRRLAGGHSGLTMAVLETGESVLRTSLDTLGADPGVRRAVGNWLAECSDDQRALLALLAEIPWLRRTDALQRCGASEIAALVAEGIITQSATTDSLRSSSSLAAAVVLSARTPEQRGAGRRLLVERIIGRWQRTRELSRCEEAFLSDLWLDEGGECLLAACPRALLDAALTACAVHANNSAHPERAAGYARAAVEFSGGVQARLELAKTRIVMGDATEFESLAHELRDAPDEHMAAYLDFAMWAQSALADSGPTDALGELLARAMRSSDPALRSRARATVMTPGLTESSGEDAARAVGEAVMAGELREADEAGLLCLVAMRLVHAGRPTDAVAAVGRATTLSRSLATSPAEAACLRVPLTITSTIARISAGDPLNEIGDDLERRIEQAVMAGNPMVARLLAFLSATVDLERGRFHRSAETLIPLRHPSLAKRLPTVLQDAISWQTVSTLLALDLLDEAETVMAETEGREYPDDLLTDHFRMRAHAALVRHRSDAEALTEFMVDAIATTAPRSRHMGAELVAIAVGFGADPERIERVAADLHNLQSRRSETHMRLLRALRLGDAVALRVTVDRYREIGLELYAAQIERQFLGGVVSRSLVLPEDAARPTTRTPLQTLTRREREIAELIGEGLTNRQIAERLYLSTRTVESHVLQARGKIGAGTRAALAAAIFRSEDSTGDERRLG